MYLLLLIAHFIVSFLLVGLILIQHGKGAQTGATFGSGASQTVFGSQGSGGFLSRTTAMLAGLFFVLNLLLVWYLNREYHPKVIQEAPVTTNEALPAGKGDIPKVD
ncbi:MAG: preprotein translocase subunit SecG [Proteobacteria bacterium]|nr:preprotein translocase subunit SecG [Pseudomonadota bacterium]